LGAFEGVQIVRVFEAGRDKVGNVQELQAWGHEASHGIVFLDHKFHFAILLFQMFDQRPFYDIYIVPEATKKFVLRLGKHHTVTNYCLNILCLVDLPLRIEAHHWHNSQIFEQLTLQPVESSTFFVVSRIGKSRFFKLFLHLFSVVDEFPQISHDGAAKKMSVETKYATQRLTMNKM
jgi:hypothetical protein